MEKTLGQESEVTLGNQKRNWGYGVIRFCGAAEPGVCASRPDCTRSRLRPANRNKMHHPTQIWPNRSGELRERLSSMAWPEPKQEALRMLRACEKRKVEVYFGAHTHLLVEGVFETGCILCVGV
eukprot:scaffold54017_cov19-Tisochrysis_lutea.AAC.2